MVWRLVVVNWPADLVWSVWFEVCTETVKKGAVKEAVRETEGNNFSYFSFMTSIAFFLSILNMSG